MSEPLVLFLCVPESPTITLCRNLKRKKKKIQIISTALHTKKGVQDFTTQNDCIKSYLQQAIVFLILFLKKNYLFSLRKNNNESVNLLPGGEKK